MAGFGIIGFAGLAAAPQFLLGVTAVATVLCIELPRSLGMVDLNARDVFKGCRRFFLYCAPEAIGLAAVFLMAVLLRLGGDMRVPKDPLSAEVWDEIKKEWPVLMGADTLLNFQSMLRVLIFTSAAFRAGLLSGSHGIFASGREMLDKSGTGQIATAMSAVTSPLSGLGAALSLGGMLARAKLCTTAEIYRLEGPLALSGYLPLLCDYCSVALLIALAFSALRHCSRTFVRTAVASAFATWLASRHYLNLAKDSSTDGLFTLTYVLEFFAALAFLGRAVMKSCHDAEGSQHGRAFVGFVHVLMAFQQALAAYYFLTAFEPSPKLVGAGRPFCVVIWSNLLALGAYLGAAGLYFGGLCAECSDDTSSGSDSRTARTDFTVNTFMPIDVSTSIDMRTASGTPSVGMINF
mmetsp:Transcript_79107/g.137117  ORF Transcript_79107/g.137117 Transcript_79107/m.137117 type:complete len:407 (-) Transcript_79107:86-1306(-)